MQLGLFAEVAPVPQSDAVQLCRREFERAERAYVLSGSAYFQPWRWGGELYGVSGICSPGCDEVERRDSLEAYRLVKVFTLAGIPDGLSAKWVQGGRLSTEDPRGAYHGVGLRHQGTAYVMVGLPRTFYKAPRGS